MSKKIGVEKAESFNAQYFKDTESKWKDNLFNSIIKRYSKNGRQFMFSDRFVWTGAVYTLPEIFGYIIFFAIFLYLGHLSLNRYGEFRTFMFFMLLLIWRVNIMVKFMGKLNQKLS